MSESADIPSVLLDRDIVEQPDPPVTATEDTSEG
jgi:hypothetical protein